MEESIFDDNKNETIINFIEKLIKEGLIELNEEIIIHFVGANENEAAIGKENGLKEQYAKLYNYLLTKGYKFLDMLFIGPGLCSIKKNIDKGSFNFSSDSEKPDQILQINYLRSQSLYHEFTTEGCHVCLMFNAGIWGYESWNATLESIRILKKAPFCLVTSFTLEENEEDVDVIEEVFKPHDDEIYWLFKCEINPHHCKKKLKNVSEAMDRNYYSNYAYSSFYFRNKKETIK